ncbi:UNKNOWN [Stylonychia lemnae]|uniref:Morn repeat protein n=1 Tax=Stylonychia lemnae TaxID=5949 RepID=A0A078AJW0_STYLE|nr:UNKNOWN [Stylonychia lemnae]|eukprot:CDW82176.1 UNKNOWN [Stylonychia lemnae]
MIGYMSISFRKNKNYQVNDLNKQQENDGSDEDDDDDEEFKEGLYQSDIKTQPINQSSRQKITKPLNSNVSLEDEMNRSPLKTNTELVLADEQYNTFNMQNQSLLQEQQDNEGEIEQQEQFQTGEQYFQMSQNEGNLDLDQEDEEDDDDEEDEDMRLQKEEFNKQYEDDRLELERLINEIKNNQEVQQKQQQIQLQKQQQSIDKLLIQKDIVIKAQKQQVEQLKSQERDQRNPSDYRNSQQENVSKQTPSNLDEKLISLITVDPPQNEMMQQIQDYDEEDDEVQQVGNDHEAQGEEEDDQEDEEQDEEDDDDEADLDNQAEDESQPLDEINGIRILNSTSGDITHDNRTKINKGGENSNSAVDVQTNEAIQYHQIIKDQDLYSQYNQTTQKIEGSHDNNQRFQQQASEILDQDYLENPSIAREELIPNSILSINQKLNQQNIDNNLKYMKQLKKKPQSKKQKLNQIYQNNQQMQLQKEIRSQIQKESGHHSRRSKAYQQIYEDSVQNNINIKNNSAFTTHQDAERSRPLSIGGGENTLRLKRDKQAADKEPKHVLGKVSNENTIVTQTQKKPAVGQNILIKVMLIRQKQLESTQERGSKVVQLLGQKQIKKKKIIKPLSYQEIQFKDGSIFKGQTRGKKINGTGELFLPDGSVFKGTFIKGKPNGYGEKEWPPTGKKYKGYWVKGKMHGKGQLKLTEGDIYIGEFRNGFPNGRGIRKFANGDFFEGDYQNGFQEGFVIKQDLTNLGSIWEWINGKMTGKGKCEWNDGTRYEGSWKDCIKEGQGTFYYQDGSFYNGDFMDDMPHGYGKRIFIDGSNYEGQLQAGVFNGSGKFRWSDGSEYDGQWRNNEMKGVGTKRLRNGQIEIHGIFDRNQVNGKGYKKWRRTFAGGSTSYMVKGTRLTEYFVYRGNLKDSKIEGQGEFKWPDGRHYIGEFRNSCMYGQGKLLWIDKNQGKSVYKGEFQANLFHGYGKLLWSNGDIYEGCFENGQYHGEGEFRWANPKFKYKGSFSKGRMHGQGVFQNPYGLFEGQFKAGFMEGKGVATFQNSDKYTGDFKQSTMTGYGCYQFNDGSQIIGLFDNGVCNDHGKKIYPNGKVYIGEFQNDIENGKGILIDGDLKIMGIWRNAVLVEELVQQNIQYDLDKQSNSISNQKRGKSTQIAQRNGLTKQNLKNTNDSEEDYGSNYNKAYHDHSQYANNITEREIEIRNSNNIFDVNYDNMDLRQSTQKDQDVKRI